MAHENRHSQTQEVSLLLALCSGCSVVEFSFCDMDPFSSSGYPVFVNELELESFDQGTGNYDMMTIAKI